MEIWKSIKGYESLYEVSNLGNVRSLDRLVDNHSGFKRLIKGRVLKPMLRRDGYYTVDLNIDSKRHNVAIHRLVAKAFIEEIDGLECVNHKDGIKTNNNVNNLEWCTHQQNMKHAYDNNISNHKIKADKILKDGAILNYYGTIQYNGMIFNNTTELGKFLGVTRNSANRICRRGYYKGLEVKATKGSYRLSELKDSI